MQFTLFLRTLLDFWMENDWRFTMTHYYIHFTLFEMLFWYLLPVLLLLKFAFQVTIEIFNNAVHGDLNSKYYSDNDSSIKDKWQPFPSISPYFPCVKEWSMILAVSAVLAVLAATAIEKAWLLLLKVLCQTLAHSRDLGLLVSHVLTIPFS